MEPWPKTAEAIWEIAGSMGVLSGTGAPSRVSCVAGSSTILTPVARARKRIEIIMAAAIPPSMARVVAALRDLGRRNIGTPFEMASTPVRAAQPEEKARMSRKAPASPASPSACPGAATRS